MKPNHLFTSMLVIAAIAVTSCSAPRLAQQSANDDDVYNSTAQAKIYTPAPAPVRSSQDTDQYNDEQYAESDYYGTSDPYYDMDYSSRINRFYYSNPWRDYYDPYFYSGWYPSYSIGFGYSPFYNNWNSPYSGWGNLYSPFWGYNNWGWNSYYGGGLFGGGFLGGGYYGGGYYGGGFYTGRTTIAPNYRARPSIGRENGVGANPRYGRPSGRGTTNGDLVSRRARAERYDAEGNGNIPSRSNGNMTRSGRTQQGTRPETGARPTRTENYTPPPQRTESRPTYSAPTRTQSSGGSSGRSSGGGGGGGARPSRGGRE